MNGLFRLGIVCSLAVAHSANATESRAAGLVTVRIAIPEEILSDQYTIVNARLGCSYSNGQIFSVVFMPEDLASGVREKTAILDWESVTSCSYAVGLMPQHFPPTISDLPLWLPIGFEEIKESLSLEPRNLLEIGLGKWKLSDLTVTLSKSAFEKRTAQMVILNVGAAGYNLAWPKEVRSITHEQAPVSYASRILYQDPPTFDVKSMWRTPAGLKKENTTTQSFDLRIE